MKTIAAGNMASGPDMIADGETRNEHSAPRSWRLSAWSSVSASRCAGRWIGLDALVSGISAGCLRSYFAFVLRLFAFVLRLFLAGATTERLFVSILAFSLLAMTPVTIRAPRAAAKYCSRLCAFAALAACRISFLYRLVAPASILFALFCNAFSANSSCLPFLAPINCNLIQATCCGSSFGGICWDSSFVIGFAGRLGRTLRTRRTKPRHVIFGRACFGFFRHNARPCARPLRLPG